jgi:hypothetical protein
LCSLRCVWQACVESAGQARASGNGELAERLEAFAAEATALLNSPSPASAVWAALTAASGEDALPGRNAGCWPPLPPPQHQHPQHQHPQQPQQTPLLVTVGGGASPPATPPPTLPAPPHPYSRCSWGRFLTLLPPEAVRSLRARAAGAMADIAACASFLSTRRGLLATRAGALWPVRDALTDCLVFSRREARQQVEGLASLLEGHPTLF